MKKLSILLFIVPLLFAQSVQAGLPSFFKDADVFLKKHVKNGKVDYAYSKKNLVEISDLYEQIGTMDLSSASAIQKKAFYLNAYNLIVIYQVSKYYPLKSPLDQSGFFDKVRHTVAGERLTLNEVEVKKIIYVYNDPRIHFALACAATSCPQLANFALLPENLDQELDKRTKLAINDPSFIKVNDSAKKVDISKIFKWYARDFTANGNTAMKFINRYRSTPIPASYQQGYYEYNWNLNAQ